MICGVVFNKKRSQRSSEAPKDVAVLCAQIALPTRTDKAQPDARKVGHWGIE
jgi:hypothetical protein